MKSLCEWFTGGKKMAVGGILVFFSVILTMIAKGSGDKGYIGYLFFVVGIACMWNTLLSKINHCNINIFLYAILILVPTCVGVAMSTAVEGSILIGVFAICVAVIWIGSTLLISTPNVFRRLVMGIFSMLMNVFVAVAGILLIALITMPAS